MVEAVKAWWHRTQAQRERMVDEYGKLAIGLYLLISVVNVAIVYWLLQRGFEIGDSAGQAVTLGLAWGSAKLFIPFRIALLVVVTPIVAGWARSMGWLPALPPTEPTTSTTPSSD